MTRGILILIQENRAVISPEFNGEMYHDSEESYGAYVMEHFTHGLVPNKEKFIQLANDINSQFYNYDIDKGTGNVYGIFSFEYADIYDLAKKLLYYMSGTDYSYVLNSTSEDIELVDREDVVITIPAYEGAVFNFACFDDTALKANWGAEVITDTDDTLYYPDEVWVTSLQNNFDFTKDEAKEIVKNGFHESQGINGCYNSVTEIGETLLCDIYMGSDAYDQLMPYIDVERFGRDLVREAEGYYELESGRVLIYNP